MCAESSASSVTLSWILLNPRWHGVNAMVYWTRRPWRAITGHAGEAGKEVIPAAAVLARIDMADEAQTVRSLERLAAAGLDLTGVPHLEASLPRPNAGH